MATVRDFKAHATRYLHCREDAYVTRQGKPIVVISPVPEKSVQAALAEMRHVLQESRLSKKALLGMLQLARREVYRR